MPKLPIGTKLVRVCIAILIVSAASTAVYSYVAGQERSLLRMAWQLYLVCWLASKLHQGRAWARWLHVAILTMAVTYGVAKLADWGPFTFLSLLTFNYSIVLGLLLFGPGVEQHFRPAGPLEEDEPESDHPGKP